MNTPDYTLRSISVSEVRQLLGKNAQPVFLILYSGEPADESSAPEAAWDSESFFAAVSAANGMTRREQTLADYLHRLGIPAHMKGYEYTKKAVESVAKDPELLCGLTKRVYPEIAKSCGKTAVSVERAIRHAIESAWNRGNIQLQEELFGTIINSAKGRPTNSEFIATIAERIRMEEF